MRTARTLRRGRAAAKSALPSLWLVTDPRRTPDPAAAAELLPRGSGVIYRAFAAPDAEQVARKLAKIARRRGLVLLIGADEALAARVGAAGVHLPETQVAMAPRLRARRPNWLITGAAHSARALACARRAKLDAALLSVAFPSHSPSAKAPLGPVRFARLARRAGLPVIALGGVNARTAGRLLGTGAVGLAAVEGLAGDGEPGNAV